MCMCHVGAMEGTCDDDDLIEQLGGPCRLGLCILDLLLKRRRLLERRLAPPHNLGAQGVELQVL